MTSENLDWLTAMAAAISAVFWVLSAKVKVNFETANRVELNALFKQASRLSMIAGVASSVAAGLPALKIVLLHLKFIA